MHDANQQVLPVLKCGDVRKGDVFELKSGGVTPIDDRVHTAQNVFEINSGILQRLSRLVHEPRVLDQRTVGGTVLHRNFIHQLRQVRGLAKVVVQRH